MRSRYGLQLTAAALAFALGTMTLLLAEQARPSSVSSQPAGHQQMLRLLAQVARDADETNFFTGTGLARKARAQLSALPPGAPDADRWRLTLEMGDQEMRLGHYPEAIEDFKQARDLLTRTRGPVDPMWPVITRFQLAIASMRLGETENCALNPAATSCILPLRGDAVHKLQRGSRQAIASFSEVLAMAPPSSPLHKMARWLLNIAYMTVGEYPDKVPERYLIPPKAFASDEDFPRFTNIAPQLGLDLMNPAGSVIADDFDNDEYLDLVISNWDTKGQLRFFRNNRDGTFVERTEQGGLRGIYGGLNMVQADYNNDGWVDILVLRGAWLERYGRYPNSLLRNNGNGTFTDVTFDAGLAAVHSPTQTASWGDYDNDGDLDLYIGNESSDSITAPSQLFRNNGDGKFTDVAVQAGVENTRYAKAVVWGDYNGDRWPDLYVSNYRGANRLYRNNGNGTFTDVAPELGVTLPMVSFPAWFWDFDNDGALDIYVGAYAADVSDLMASALGQPITTELATLYRGTGTGRFEEVSSRHNLRRPNAPMGSNFGDLDNDGYLDFYLGTGYPTYQSLMPNVMYRNREGKSFADVSTAGGFAHLQKGHGIAFADFDHDGDQDIFEVMGGAFPGDRAIDVFYENPGSANHWITIKLEGMTSNRSAIGARIRAEVIDGGNRRSIYKHVNSGGTFGANPLRQTIGLRQATVIDLLEVFWPTTGRTQSFRNVPVDRAIQIVEGEATYTRLKVEPYKFGHAAGSKGHEHKP